MKLRPDPRCASPDDIVLMTSTNPNASMTKTTRFMLDGQAKKAEGASITLLFTWEVTEVANIEALRDLLTKLSEQLSTIAIRGAVIEGVTDRSGWVRRRYSHSAVDPTITDAPRSWAMIDIDKAVLDNMRLSHGWLNDPELTADTVQWIIEAALPPAFHDADVVVQWSGSMAPAGGTPKVHLWFRLSRPLTCWALKRWLKTAAPHVDHSVLHSGHIYYTARPICIDHTGNRCEDPLGERRVELFEADGSVPVPREIEDISVEEDAIEVDRSVEVKLNPDFIPNPESRTWRTGLKAIGDHPGGEGFHLPIRNTLMRYVVQAYVPVEGPPDFGEVAEAITKAAMAAELSDPERAFDRDNRLADMLRSFNGAVTKVHRNLQIQQQALAEASAIPKQPNPFHQIFSQLRGVRT